MSEEKKTILTEKHIKDFFEMMDGEAIITFRVSIDEIDIPEEWEEVVIETGDYKGETFEEYIEGLFDNWTESMEFELSNEAWEKLHETLTRKKEEGEEGWTSSGLIGEEVVGLVELDEDDDEDERYIVGNG